MKKICYIICFLFLSSVCWAFPPTPPTPSASDTQVGSVELSTDAETVTGTATDKAVTPANLTTRLSTPYQQTVIVAKSGSNYTTIQGAIDSVTDATANKRYAVIVYPGVYTENIVMEDYVDIVGFGRTNSIISATSGTAVTFPANKGTVMDVGITTAYGTLGANSTAVSSAGADSAMVRCDLIVSKSSGDFTMNSVSVTAGSFRMTDCYHEYNITGTTTDTGLTQSAFSQTGALTLFLVNNNELVMACDDTNDTVAGFETDSGSIGSFILKNNILTISAAYRAGALWLKGTATGATVTDNRFTISGTADTSWGLYIDSDAGGATVKTLSNEINITSSGNAYSCAVLTGDIWNSFFDEITAAEGTTGAGTVNMASSLATGGFLATGGRDFSKLDLTADTTLTEAQIRQYKYISNQGDDGEADLKLPAVSYAIGVIFSVEEAQNIEINPPTDEIFDLDGVALDANDCVDSDSTVGSKIAATRLQIADGTWRWSLDTIRGNWVDTGASD